MACGRDAGLMLVVLLVCPMAVWVAPARAQTTIAPDDPKLIAKMNEVCLATALHSGGLDQKTRDFCGCVSPVFSRHMTPDSREKLLVENRTDLRPSYDDDDATFNDLMKTCPPKP